MGASASIFASPEHQMPQIAEAMKKNTIRDFRVERIRKRQSDMAERREVAEIAAKEFDERRLARKALPLLRRREEELRRPQGGGALFACAPGYELGARERGTLLGCGSLASGWRVSATRRSFSGGADGSVL